MNFYQKKHTRAVLNVKHCCRCWIQKPTHSCRSLGPLPPWRLRAYPVYCQHYTMTLKTFRNSCVQLFRIITSFGDLENESWMSDTNVNKWHWLCTDSRGCMFLFFTSILMYRTCSGMELWKRWYFIADLEVASQ